MAFADAVLLLRLTQHRQGVALKSSREITTATPLLLRGRQPSRDPAPPRPGFARVRVPVLDVGGSRPCASPRLVCFPARVACRGRASEQLIKGQAQGLRFSSKFLDQLLFAAFPSRFALLFRGGYNLTEICNREALKELDDVGSRRFRLACRKGHWLADPL